jgi:hypothetical protein
MFRPSSPPNQRQLEASTFAMRGNNDYLLPDVSRPQEREIFLSPTGVGIVPLNHPTHDSIKTQGAFLPLRVGGVSGADGAYALT